MVRSTIIKRWERRERGRGDGQTSPVRVRNCTLLALALVCFNYRTSQHVSDQQIGLLELFHDPA